MFERFTEKAIKTIMLAQEESRRMGHNFVSTEQILLGLIGEGTGVAAKALKGMGCNLRNARAEVEKIIGRGSGRVVIEIPFTAEAKGALEQAWDEARRLDQTYIGTEHLLLGLLRRGNPATMSGDTAIRVLKELGVDLEVLQGHVLKSLREKGRSGASDPLPQNSEEEQPLSDREQTEDDSFTTGSHNASMPFIWQTCPNCAESVRSPAHVCHHCGYGIADEQFTNCAFCRERIRIGATKCRYCLTIFNETV